MYFLKLTYVLTLVLIGRISLAQDLPRPFVQLGSIPSLGGGIKSDTGELLSRKVGGYKEYHGAQRTSWDVKTNLSSTEKAFLISGSAELELNYKVFSANGNLDLDMVNKHDGHSFTITGVFEAKGKSVLLHEAQVLDRYIPMQNRSDAQDIFGDAFVSSVDLGGRLVLDISVNFHDSEESTRVKGMVEVELANLVRGAASAEVTDLLNETNISMVVKAVQVGGNVGNLPKIFGNGGCVKSCVQGNADECINLVENLLKYSVDFGEQLDDMKYAPANPLGAAHLGYSITPYRTAGIGPSFHPIIDINAKRLQKQLTEEYFKLVADYNYIKGKQNLGINCDEFEAILDIIESNIEMLVEIIEYTQNDVSSLQQERNRYFSEKKSYQNPEGFTIDGYAYYRCKHCLNSEILNQNSKGAYILIKNGITRMCSRCEGDVDFYCAGDRAYFNIKGRDKNGTIITRQGKEVNGDKVQLEPLNKYFNNLNHIKNAVIQIKN